MSLEEQLKEISQQIVEFLLKKNQDYDNAFLKLLDKYGDLALLIHLEEKLNRLNSLTKKEGFFEKKEDTIKDIIGYCLLYLVHQKTNCES